jgi:hypothetical protein
MKTRNNLNSLFILLVLLSLTNCSPGNKKEEALESQNNANATSEKATETIVPQFEVDENFQQQLGHVFDAYVSLKDAFVSSDPQKVKSEANATSLAVNKVDMKLLTGAAHNDWMTFVAPMETSLKEIAGSPDIEVQRKEFSVLSDNLYKSIKAFGLGGKQAFYDYCPMAFENEGAYWLSDNDKIQNPYFGDQMLNCGEVREKLQ